MDGKILGIEKKIEVASETRQEIIEWLFSLQERRKELEQKGSVGENFEAYKFSVYSYRELTEALENILNKLNAHIEELSQDENTAKEEL